MRSSRKLFDPLLSFQKSSLANSTVFERVTKQAQFHTCLNVMNFERDKSKQREALAGTLSSENISSTTCPFHSVERNHPMTITSHESTSSQPHVLKTQKTYDEIPGPNELPFFGSWFSFLKHAKNTSPFFLELCEKYGDMVRVTALGHKMLILANPHMIGDLFKVEDKRSPLNSVRFYKDQRGMELSSVEMKYDEDWNSVRQLYNIAMKPEFVEKVSVPQLTELNGEFLRRMIKYLHKTQDGNIDTYRLLNGVDAISRYGFDAVLKVFLGVTMTDDLVQSFPFNVADFVNYSVRGLDLAVRLDSKPAIYKYFKTAEFKELEMVFDRSFEYARYCMARFKDNPSGKPRFVELLQERAKDLPNAQAKVESVMIAFLQAAVDITMRIMTHVMYRMAHHTEYQEKLYEECVQIFGEPTMDEITSEHGLEITAEQYKKLKHVKHFLEETLRLNSFAYMTQGRILNQDREIGGYLIPKDTQILIMQRYATLRDEFCPRGTEFIPERHEKGSPLAMKSNYVSVPFGVGARKCPGSRIATTELHFGIINLVRHFKLSHENPQVFPESSFDQALLYIDLNKHPLYLTPRDHVKEYMKSVKMNNNNNY